MANVSAADVVGALQVLTQSMLTAQQITDLMGKPDLTDAEVQAQLDQTDSTIDRLTAED